MQFGTSPILSLHSLHLSVGFVMLLKHIDSWILDIKLQLLHEHLDKINVFQYATTCNTVQ